VPGYGARFGILFGLLFLIDAGLLAISLARREFLLHLAGGLGTLVSLVAWLAQSYSSAAWPGVLAVVAVFFLVYLLAEPLASALGRKADAPLGRATRVAPFLLVAVPALVALEPAALRPLPLFGTAFVLLGLAAAAAITRKRGTLYYVAVFFVLWRRPWSARYLAPERLGTALVLYLVFGLAYLGVPCWLAASSALAPPWGGGAVLIASLVLLLYLADHRVAPGALFGLALLLAILNAGLFIETASARLPALSLVGGFLSWIVLAAWWLEAADTVALLPALAVVTGLALLMLAGHAWVQSRTAEAAARGFSVGSALGLVAHIFLLAVAADPQLGIPPWPVFAGLAVLALAFAGAALYLRDGAFHAAATLAGAIVLLVWIANAPTAAWCSVGLVALGVLAAFALAAIRMGRAVGDSGTAWSVAAVIALAALHFGAILSSGATAPATAVLAAAHVVALGTLLAVATARGWLKLGLLAVGTGAFAVLVFATLHAGADQWPARLGLAAAIYAVFLAWPFAAGQAAVGSREPWLAAILASAPFFFAARQALVAGGYKHVIGALPLAQAAAMALLLRRLLAVEPARGRDTGRLALVAGAALAFVTVAIPLQLEKQWITIGWALEGAALAWLYRRIAHRGLLLTSAGLLGAAFVRLALNPEIFHYTPRSEVPIFNWYLYTYLVCAAALVVAGRRCSPPTTTSPPPCRACRPQRSRARALLFLLLNIEIADFYAEE
jgi:hypothetical protein